MRNAIIILVIISAFIFAGCPPKDNPTGATTGDTNPGGGNCFTASLDSTLTFTTGGGADWTCVTSPAYAGTESAASGDITHSQISWLKTVASGPGTLSFYWKVSCEESIPGFGDMLCFMVNNVTEAARASNDGAWQQINYNMATSGSFTFIWQYYKDSSGSGGLDKVWVDKVELNPAANTGILKPWGVTTTAAAWGQRSDFGYCAHNPGSGSAMYIVGGAVYGLGGQDDVWASTDGQVWSQIKTLTPFGAKWGHTVVTHKPVSWPAEAMYVIAGYTQSGGLPTGGSSDSSDVWASGDGVDWVLMTGCVSAGQFVNRRHTAAVSYNNKLWVIGGYYGSYLHDVWYSDEGSVWGCSTTAAAFTGRYGHTLTSFNGKMWVIGGFDGGSGSSLCNDVWYSTDGANWYRAAEDAGFSVRSQHCAVVYDNKLWIIGGSGYDTQEVWYTEDGFIWHNEGAPEWPTRNQFGAVVHKDGLGDKLWVFGGNCGQGTYGSCDYRYQDVWYTDKN